MNRKVEKLNALRNEYINSVQYRRCQYKEFDYKILNHISWVGRQAIKGSQYSTAIIMADTETSKKHTIIDNHVVLWTIAIRAYSHNVVCLYGRKPSEFVECCEMIHENLNGITTIIYFHNLSYDWVFLRKFMFKQWGYPEHQLNTKPHYPISIEFENHIIFRDSLILAQRKLEKWGEDLQIEHIKRSGQWDYSILRNQDTELTEQELEYAEYDVLAGVECIDATLKQLNKTIATIPYTATGIPRGQVRDLGRKNRARDYFKSAAMTYEQYVKGLCTYHGGYVHANRHEIGYINHDVVAYDFASSYPYCMIAEKFPCEKFMQYDNCDPEHILKYMDSYAWMFKFIVINAKLKSDDIIMPALQFSKCIKTINAICDNGRILKCDYAEIYITEQDLDIIMQQYDFKYAYCVDVHVAAKNYLPKWFRDYVYECFKNKTQLKGGDPVEYAIAKSIVNSLYGMCVQRSIPDTVNEDYETGEYERLQHTDPESEYEHYLNSRSSILLYQTGIWVTAYAFHHLFELGQCVADNELWLYSDTDSCYATGWNAHKIDRFNQKCKQKLLLSGDYGAVIRDGISYQLLSTGEFGKVKISNKEYWLGVAELDGEYKEFITLGCKRYAVRKQDGSIKITVAGVPKAGYKCLDNDLRNFRSGLIFSGSITGKLEHKYIFVDDIYIDDHGNETGDSIDLSPCDYTLDSTNIVDWNLIDTEEINIQVYG